MYTRKASIKCTDTIVSSFFFQSKTVFAFSVKVALLHFKCAAGFKFPFQRGDNQIDFLALLPTTQRLFNFFFYAETFHICSKNFLDHFAAERLIFVGPWLYASKIFGWDSGCQWFCRRSASFETGSIDLSTLHPGSPELSLRSECTNCRAAVFKNVS
jgi:hypothetical protein